MLLEKGKNHNYTILTTDSFHFILIRVLTNNEIDAAPSVDWRAFCIIPDFLNTLLGKKKTFIYKRIF